MRHSLVLGQLPPRKFAPPPNPKTNLNPNPNTNQEPPNHKINPKLESNPDPNRGQFSSGGNCPDDVSTTYPSERYKTGTLARNGLKETTVGVLELNRT